MKQIQEIFYKDTGKLFTRLYCSREELRSELEKNINYYNKYHHTSLTVKYFTLPSYKVELPTFFSKKFEDLTLLEAFLSN